MGSRPFLLKVGSTNQGCFPIQGGHPIPPGSECHPPPHPTKEEERLHRLAHKRAVSFYITRKRNYCVDDQLFVGYIGKKKGKAIMKRTLWKWIVLCIKICYSLAKKVPPEGIRAHSTCAKTSSSALARGVPIADICKAVTWASLHTFAKHYCLDSEVRRDGYLARSVLQDFLV